ncbi:MAG: DUF2799 domain-containing protein [Lysobacterales bacterium]
MRPLTLVFLISLLLPACRVADLSGCPEKDPGLVGQEDGLAGRAATLPRPDCMLDISDVQRYEDGREDGLRRYCSAQRGYQLGLEGTPINTEVCSANFAKELERGHAVGDSLRQHLSQRDQLLSQAQDIERIAADQAEDSPERQALLQQAADARFQARQHDNEVEALRGVVAVEKWR